MTCSMTPNESLENSGLEFTVHDFQDGMLAELLPYLTRGFVSFANSKTNMNLFITWVWK